jgi:hypothetical protein
MTTKIEWVLRIGVFGTFLGHGLMAITSNPSWAPYLITIGFNQAQALNIMPFIGSLDVIVALWVLIKPNKYVVLWAVFWALATAIIRPLSGELFLTFVERAANWAVPLALYFYRINISKNSSTSI